MAPTYQRVGVHGTTQGGSYVNHDSLKAGTDFSKIQRWDLVTFLAIAQGMRIQLLDFQPNYDNGDVVKGSMSGAIHVVEGVVFKQMLITEDFTEELAYKSLISEILVLEHPALSSHPNIQRLLGIAFDIQSVESTFIRVLPLLVFRDSRHGNLQDFFKKKSDEHKLVTLTERLQFCVDIGNALEAMHSINIAHGDIKPQNVLTFDVENKEVAKIIDFGCSYFGSSEEDSITIRWISPDWVAPEIIGEGDSDAAPTIKDAKKADVYSYGKLCAWILLKPEMTAESFESHQFSDFHEVQQHDGGDVRYFKNYELSAIQKVMPLLGSFFQQSFCTDATERAPITTLLGILSKVHEKCNSDRSHSSITISHILKFTVRGLSRVSYGLHLMNYTLRAFVAKIITFRGRKGAEFSVPGQLQIVFLHPNTMFTIGIFLYLLVFGVVVALIVDSVKKKKTHDLWAFVVYLVVVLTFAAIGGYRIYRSVRTDFQSLFRIFMVFGWNQHSVPSLPQLYPLLNRLHFQVRAEVVKGLQVRLQTERTKNYCETCVSQSALQLALCYYTAFGTPKNDAVSEHLLLLSGSKDLGKLCKEIEFWEKHYQKVSIDSDPGDYEKELEEHDLTIHEVPRVIDFYQSEIDGKIEANVCSHSAIVLQESLGDLYMSAYLYQEAEEAYRTAVELMDKAPILRGFWGMDRSQSDEALDNHKEDLAQALERQGKFQEAIEVLKTTVIVKKHIKKRTNAQWRSYMGSKNWIAKLLLKQYKTDEKEIHLRAASDVGLIAELKSKLKDKKSTKKMLKKRAKSTLKILRTLAEAWNTIGESVKSMEILHERVDLCLELFDKDKKELYMANYDLAVGFLQSGYGQPGRALAIQNQLFELSTFEEMDPERLAVMTAMAVAHSRVGAHQKAVEKMDSILQIKSTALGDTHSISLGCMNELAGSLSVVGKDALSKPAAIQYDLLALFRTSSDVELRTKYMDVLWSFSRPECLPKAMSEMESLLVLLESKYDQLGPLFKIQSFLVFVLAHLGFTFEDLTILEKAEKLNLELKERQEEFFGADRVETLDTLEGMASIYWMKCNILCTRCGFARRDFVSFDLSIQAHERVHDLSSNTLGQYHGRTIAAKERLARALSDIGIARDDEKMMFKAQDLFKEAILLHRDQPDATSAGQPGQEDASSQATYELSSLQFYRKDATSKDLKFAYKNYRGFLFGDKEKFHPGELALLERLASTMLERDHYSTPSRKLDQGFLRFRSFRKKWSDTPDLHPDYLRAIEAYANAEYEGDRAFNERSETRCLNWYAEDVHKDKSQRHCIMRYKMALGSALSVDKCYWDEAAVIAKEVLTEARSTFGEEHTQTAFYTKELARLYWKTGKKDEAKHLYVRALEANVSILGAEHFTFTTWDILFKKLAELKDRDKFSDLVQDIVRKYASVEKRGRDLEKSDFSTLERWARRAGSSRIALGDEHEFTVGAFAKVQSLCREYKVGSANTKSITQELKDLEEFPWLKRLKKGICH